MALAISFHDAVSLVGGFPVLAGLDLEVAEGAVVVVHGPNGAGKTSLLRACAGLLAINSGEASVLGHDLRTDRESLRRDVGLLGHTGSLYEDLSALDNVVFAVRAAHGDVARVSPALERLGLVGRVARTRYARLSAGQRRRCALAALLARGARLWLLDEPHAGLDAEARAVLDGLIDEMRADGATVLISSHELETVAPLADRVVEVVGGAVRPALGPMPRAAAPNPLVGTPSPVVGTPSPVAGAVAEVRVDVA